LVAVGSVWNNVDLSGAGANNGNVYKLFLVNGACAAWWWALGW